MGLFKGVCLVKHWHGDLEQICQPSVFQTKDLGQRE